MNTNEQNTAPKLLSERLLRYSNELSGPSSGELVALLREAATVICDLSHDAALVRQSVEHGWAAAALAPPSGEGVEDWHELASEAVYVGLCIGVDCAGKLAELQESGIYKPRCEDGKPSNANARRDADKIADIYRRGLVKLRAADTLSPISTTPQSAPVDGDVEVDVAACKREPYPGVITSAPTTDALEAFTALRNALDNSMCYCGVDPIAIVTLRQDEARRMLDAITTPPPASQEREVDGWQVVRDAIAIHQSFNTTEDMTDWLRDLLPPSSAAEASINSPEIDSKLIPDAAEQAKPMSIQQMFDAEQAQAGEVEGNLDCWLDDLSNVYQLKSGSDIKDADYKRLIRVLRQLDAIRSRLAGGVTVDVPEIRKVAKRNLRSLIERCRDSEKELMLKCLEELS